MRSMTIFASALFAGALGALLLTLPAASQAGRDDEETEMKAEAAKLAADPALSAEANAAFLANNLKQQGVQHTRTGLQFKILQNGFGRHPGGGDTVEVYYTGKLINGKVFDGTSPGLPATFPLSQVVPGWVEALQLMRVGDHWMIWVPNNLAYNPKDSVARGLPPYQTLIFDVRLLTASSPPKLGDPGCAADPSCSKDMQQQGQQ